MSILSKKIFYFLITFFILTSRCGWAADPTTVPQPSLEISMHLTMIKQIAIDAKGKWLATVSEDKTARVWDISNGNLVNVLRPPQNPGDEGKLYAVAVSPDGETVAVGGWTGYDWNNSISIYLFDRASGRLRKQIQGLPNVVLRLAFSQDGRFLVASLGMGQGIRLYDAVSNKEIGRDALYNDASYSVHFNTNSNRLVTTCLDGSVRLYSVDNKGIALLAKLPFNGKRPLSARFSPTGQFIAVSFYDSATLEVLDGKTLGLVYTPYTGGVARGDLGNIAWSSDGRYLFAGGTADINEKMILRRWNISDRFQFDDTHLADNTISSLIALPHGGLVFATADPAWGIINDNGHVLYRKKVKLADLRDHENELGISNDGRRIRFSFNPHGKQVGIFNTETLEFEENDSGFFFAITSNSRLKLDYQKYYNHPPLLNGIQLSLDPDEKPRCHAITPDDQHVVIGSEWSLRLFDRMGNQIWQQPVPGVAWAVNVSLDGRFVVVGYDDGTIRWHRLHNGKEILALFPLPDNKRWIAWTSDGFYAASGSVEEELVGYRINNGKNHEGVFISSRQLRENFYQPSLISQILNKDGDIVNDKYVHMIGNVMNLLSNKKNYPPEISLISHNSISKENILRIVVKIESKKSNIDRIICRVNDAERECNFRQVGIISDGTEETFIDLSGKNDRISLSAVNKNGVESNQIHIIPDATYKEREKPSLHVLSVGITNYKDESLRKGSQFAVFDSEEIIKFFYDRWRIMNREINPIHLKEFNAKSEDISRAFRQISNKVNPQDVFVLYFAGHGVSLEGEYNFMAWDTDTKTVTSLRQNSLTNEHLRSLLKTIRANNIIVLLDTCDSGGFNLPRWRGYVGRLSRLSGRAIIAATRDGMKAIEGIDGHGAFTYVLLKGLNGEANNRSGTIETRDLANYVMEKLPQVSLRKTGYKQLPSIFIEGSSFTLVPN